MIRKPLIAATALVSAVASQCDGDAPQVPSYTIEATATCTEPNRVPALAWSVDAGQDVTAVVEIDGQAVYVGGLPASAKSWLPGTGRTTVTISVGDTGVSKSVQMLECS